MSLLVPVNRPWDHRGHDPILSDYGHLHTKGSRLALCTRRTPQRLSNRRPLLCGTLEEVPWQTISTSSMLPFRSSPPGPDPLPLSPRSHTYLFLKAI